MKLPTKLNLATDGGRFLIAGLLNSLCSLVIYQLLLFVMSPSLSYLITWILGIGFVALTYPRYVFVGARTDRSTKSFTALVYVSGFGLGLGFIALFDLVWPGNRLSILVAMILTTVLNFVLLRKLLRRSGGGKQKTTSM